MTKPIKIYELKGQDWMKGVSIQADSQYGGIFQTCYNFNPFEKMGYLQPSLASTIVDATTIATQVNHFVAYQDAYDYVYALGDRSGTGAKSLYKIKVSDLSVTDLSSYIDTNVGTGAVVHGGAIEFSGLGEYRSLVYEQQGSIRALRLSLAADTNLLTSALTNTNYLTTDFCIGSDLNLYYTAGFGYSIGKVITVASTTGNTATALQLQAGIFPRSITSNGYYLIAVGDNNENRLTTSTSRCKVYFWDKVKSTADVIWDVPDTYLVGVRFVAGRILIIGYAGIWECSLNSAPKLVLPIENKSILPTDVRQIKVQGNYLVWASPALGSRIWMYGANIGKPILFSPYQSSGGSDLQTGLGVAGSNLFVGTDYPKTYCHNTGTTRANATVVTATTDFDQPFMFSYAKVVLKDPLSSGQQVALGMWDSGGRIIMDTNTKYYSTDGAKKEFIFRPNPSSVGIKTFDDMYLSVNAVAGAAVKRVAIYGTPIGDDSQIL